MAATNIAAFSDSCMHFLKLGQCRHVIADQISLDGPDVLLLLGAKESRTQLVAVNGYSWLGRAGYLRD